MSELKEKFKSGKVYNGFSTCFRQWRAEGTHCQFLHGYAVEVEIDFVGELDERNWVADFGGAKRSKHKIKGMNPSEWLTWLLDHTTVVAESDPQLPMFKQMEANGMIKLRILPEVGCEMFAQFIFKEFNHWILMETNGRVSIDKVTVRENYKNKASYEQH